MGIKVGRVFALSVLGIDLDQMQLIMHSFSRFDTM